MLYLLSLLEPSSGDRMALLVLEELLGCLHELVADIALEHACDQVDLQVPLVHGPCLTHKVAEHTFKALREGEGERRRLHVYAFARHYYPKQQNTDDMNTEVQAQFIRTPNLNIGSFPWT